MSRTGVTVLVLVAFVTGGIAAIFVPDLVSSGRDEDAPDERGEGFDLGADTCAGLRLADIQGWDESQLDVVVTGLIDDGTGPSVEAAEQLWDTGSAWFDAHSAFRSAVPMLDADELGRLREKDPLEFAYADRTRRAVELKRSFPDMSDSELQRVLDVSDTTDLVEFDGQVIEYSATLQANEEFIAAVELFDAVVVPLESACDES